MRTPWLPRILALILALLILVPQVLWFTSPVLLSQTFVLGERLIGWLQDFGLYILLPGLVLVFLLLPEAWPRFQIRLRKFRQGHQFDQLRAIQLFRGLGQDPNPMDLKEIGTMLCEAHRYQEAIPFLELSTKEAPKEAWTWHYLALAYQALHQTDKAFDAASTAFRLDPDLGTGDHLLLTAELALETQQPQVGLNLAERSNLVFGESIRSLSLQARALFDLDRKSEIPPLLEKLLEFGPGRGKRYTPEEKLIRIQSRRALSRGSRP